jgi:hypothetical protein
MPIEAFAAANVSAFFLLSKLHQWRR